MYGRKANGELKQAELEEARLGFIQFLRRKNFSPQFIASHGDDLFRDRSARIQPQGRRGRGDRQPRGLAHHLRLAADQEPA